MTTDFNALDKIHAAKNSDDRANRGVKLVGWGLAALFSVLFYVAAYYGFYSAAKAFFYFAG